MEKDEDGGKKLQAGAGREEGNHEWEKKKKKIGVFLVERDPEFWRGFS